MKLPFTFVQSKVARRVLLLFVSCALLPIAILAVVSFFEVSSQLREESRKRLTQASRNQGMAIFEHLDILDSDLRVIADQVRQGHPFAAGLPRNHLDSLAVFTPDGRAVAQLGEALNLPHLGDAERRHLLGGNALLQTEKCASESSTCVYMLRLADASDPQSRIVMAEPNQNFLWAPNSLASDLHLCVFSSLQSVEFCSDGSPAGTASLPKFGRSSDFFQWRESGTLYDAAYWKLLVKPAFLQDSWTIVVSQEHAAVLAPMARFQTSFPLVVLLALWIVLLLSMIQVRRTLDPVRKLEEGTRQIAARRFENRVEVRTGDEFEGLAASFNTMAAQLGRQFHTLTTIHEMGQAIFASLNRETIVDGVLARMPGLLPWDCFGVFILQNAQTTGWIRFRNSESGQVFTETFNVPALDWNPLREHPQAFTVAGQQRIPSYLTPLGRNGMRSFLILPVQVENSVVAALICARRAVEEPTLDHLPEVRQVADQLAVAISHASLVQALEQLHLGTLTALARAIDAKSQWTAGHSERVTHWAIEIGRYMGLSSNELKIMHRGGMLHDIGKIGTPPVILDKPGKLTPDEMRVMQEHVRTGLRILEPIPGFAEALPIVSQHHEWFNGGGYPEGLAGKGISLYARIFAVADCYDALTSDRPYRKGLGHEQTMALLQAKAGAQFDPEVIEVFTRMMAETMPEQKSLSAFVGKPQ